MTEYDKYLANLHAEMTTPDEVIREVTNDALGQKLSSKTRIIAGEDNEVYDAALEDGSHQIMRISRSEKLAFEQERWAIEKCREIGIPAPKVLAIKHLDVGGKLLHFCIQEKLPGESLERGGLDFHSFSEERKKKIIIQAGEMLSKIHSVKTDGFGGIDGAGKGDFKTFGELMREHIGQEDQYLSVAKDVGFETDALKKIFQILKEKGDAARNMVASLNHNDFGPKHIMVKKDVITGILDFGDVSGHSPVNDFARWDYWYGEEISTDWLKEGYKNKELFGQDFDATLRWIRLNNGLEVLWWYHNQKYVEAIELAKKRLHEDLAAFVAE